MFRNAGSVHPCQQLPPAPLCLTATSHAKQAKGGLCDTTEGLRSPNFHVTCLEWFFFFDRVSQCSPDCAGTSFVDQAGLRFICLCVLNARIKGVHHLAWL